MNQSELMHLIKKCYNIDKELGGNADKLKKGKKSKEFDVIKEVLIEKIFQVNKLQDQRDQQLTKYGNDKDQIALGVRIRDEIKESDRLIGQLNEALQRMSKNKKKFTQAEIELRTKLVTKYQENVENLKSRELGEKDPEFIDVEKPFMMKDMQQNLFGRKQDREVVYEMTKEEQEALKRFEDNDRIMDDKLDIIIDGGQRLHAQAQNIGQKIDQTNKQIHGLTKEVDKTNETLLNSNKKLKQLILKFRQPNKFCLDITLFLLFLGIIAVIVNMIYKGG